METFKPQDFLKQYTHSQETYYCYDLQSIAQFFGQDIASIPYCIRVLMENVVRNSHGAPQRLQALKKLICSQNGKDDIPFFPSRILMQDFTGVPAIVDLATLRDAIFDRGLVPEMINPGINVDLVIDHSIIVDSYGQDISFSENKKNEYQRNKERYQFLKWGQKAFKNFRVVPPGAGICHQVNLEYLASVVTTEQTGGKNISYPDTLVGTDSHTTMINALGVLGWGVGGIEAEAAMLGQPYSMRIPEVVGVKLNGSLQPGVTATDLVLTITQILRKFNVVGKFVEFYGSGLDCLTLADRATIANMAPEYGATCGFFPVDQLTLDYLRLTGRDEAHVQFVEEHCRNQSLLWSTEKSEPTYFHNLCIELGDVETSLAGPRRPQERLSLSEVGKSFQEIITKEKKKKSQGSRLADGAVVIAAITSCTNTSNPAAMIGAGLVAQKARKLGLKVKPWVKTSLAPGSQVVTDYLARAGLQQSLDELGFNLVGYGCTTCIGNAGPLAPEIEDEIKQQELTVASVLSGNRNFGGRISPLTQLNYLASPMLVVVYAVVGTVNIDLTCQAVGCDASGNVVYLKDLWPTPEEIQKCMERAVCSRFYQERYQKIFKGDAQWDLLNAGESDRYSWDEGSTYVKKAPYFDLQKNKDQKLSDIVHARALVVLGDGVTTDHISPAGVIQLDSPAGLYLQKKGVLPEDFNSYGARRGNHEVMMRGAFSNVRIRNEMLLGTIGGYTYGPDNVSEVMPIYDAAMMYIKKDIPLIVIAGKEYGTGSSRDWAAKGPALLGVKAIVAESFERIHRSNLIGMGVLPLAFPAGVTRQSLAITGQEHFDIEGMEKLTVGSQLILRICCQDGAVVEQPVICRIDTQEELDYYCSGGILPFVLTQMMDQASNS